MNNTLILSFQLTHYSLCWGNNELRSNAHFFNVDTKKREIVNQFLNVIREDIGGHDVVVFIDEEQGDEDNYKLLVYKKRQNYTKLSEYRSFDSIGHGMIINRVVRMAPISF